MANTDFLNIQQRAARLFFEFGGSSARGIGRDLKNLSELAEKVLASEEMSAKDPDFMKTFGQLEEAAETLLAGIRAGKMPVELNSKINEIVTDIKELSNQILPEKNM